MARVGYVLVGFGGGWGTQVAVILRERGEPDTFGNTSRQFKLSKWRAQGKRWTQPAWFPADCIKGEATEADLKKYGVQPYVGGDAAVGTR